MKRHLLPYRAFENVDNFNSVGQISYLYKLLLVHQNHWINASYSL